MSAAILRRAADQSRLAEATSCLGRALECERLGPVRNWFLIRASLLLHDCGLGELAGRISADSVDRELTRLHDELRALAGAGRW